MSRRVFTRLSRLTLTASLLFTPAGPPSEPLFSPEVSPSNRGSQVPDPDPDQLEHIFGVVVASGSPVSYVVPSATVHFSGLLLPKTVFQDNSPGAADACTALHSQVCTVSLPVDAMKSLRTN